MELIDQTILHDPENGKWGNCYQAALATLLQLPLEEVPHFYDQGVFDKFAEQEWLAERGFTMLWLTVPEFDLFKETAIRRCFHLISGSTERFNGEVDHVVVAKDGKTFFDPHPSRAGLKIEKVYGVLIKLEPFAR